MTDHDFVMTAARQANPRPTGTTGPDGEWSTAELLAHIEHKSDIMEAIEPDAPPLGAERKSRRGLLVAAAAAAVVLLIGAAIFALVVDRNDADVVEPTPTTLSAPTTVPTPTTGPPQTTVPATTVPATTVTAASEVRSVFAAGPSVVLARPDTECSKAPGAVVAAAGTFYMIGQSLDGVCEFGEPTAWWATSEDGSRWSFEGQLFTDAELSVPYSGEHPVLLSSAVVLDDGTWAVYFHTVPVAFSPANAVSLAGVIGRATAPGPEGPWTADPEPVLTPGPAGAWDADGVGHPSVLRVGDEYWMYYDGHNAVPEGPDRAIGLAVSSDGVTWTKRDNEATPDAPFADSDPVLAADAGAWDGARVYDPGVALTDEGFVMTYVSAEQIPNDTLFTYGFGAAYSDDGLSWTKDPINPFFEPTKRGFDWLSQTTLLATDAGYQLFSDMEANLDSFVWVLSNDGAIRP